MFADLVILGGNVLNVYTGEILENHSIAICGGRIVDISTDIDNYLGDKTTVINASGKLVLPGLIAAHTHMDILAPISEYAKALVHEGVTTIVTELISVANCAGYEALIDYVNRFDQLPIKVFGLAPVMLPPEPGLGSGRHLSLKLVDCLLSNPRILGIGEVYWPRVVNARDEFVRSAIRTALDKNKVVEGHSAGARGKSLRHT